MSHEVMEEEDRLHSLKTVNGSILTVGDTVIHEQALLENRNEDSGIITGFYWDKRLGEYRAKTDKGHAGLDYLTKVEQEGDKNG